MKNLWIALLLGIAALTAHASCNCSDGNLASGGLGNTEGVAVDDAYAWFGSEDQFLRRVPKNGGSVDVLTRADLPIGRVRVDATTVYFTTFTDRNVEGIGSIYSIPKSGGTATKLTSGRIYEMDIDASYVYWTDFNGSLSRMPKSGGAVEQLAALTYPLGFIFDGSDVIVSEAGTQSVWRVPKGGGSKTVIEQGTTVNFITTDGTYLYMSGLLAPSIYKVAKTGGSVQALASGQTFASGIGYVNGKVYTALDDNIGPNGSLLAIDPVSGALTVVRANRYAAHVFTWDDCAIYLTHWNSGGTLEKICVETTSTPAGPGKRRAAGH